VPIAVDTWAYEFAMKLARETGWRRSEVYQFVAQKRRDGDSTQIIADAMDILVALSRPGDSFAEARMRIVDLTDAASRDAE
jgi:hypothetical protein